VTRTQESRDTIRLFLVAFRYHSASNVE